MIINFDSGASSRSSTEFNSACRVGDTVYLMTAAGLVKLDDVQKMDATVTFAKQDFGTSRFKHCPYAYAGVSAEGPLYLDVSTSSATYTYTIRDFDAELQQQRFDLGRGMRSSWYVFRLYNDGDHFELADFTLMPVASSRRI